MRGKKIAVAAAAAIVAVALGVATAIGADNGNLDEARKFDKFRVYFAGQRVAGLDFERFERWDTYGEPRGTEVIGIYGDCVPLRGETCSYELEITNTSICWTYPQTYYYRPKLKPINGAMGGWVKRVNVFDVYTGKTAISIAGLPRKRAVKVAKQLIDVRANRRADDLPSVKRTYLRGKHRCQKPRF